MAEAASKTMNGERLSLEFFPIKTREIFERCWKANPAMRPDFEELLKELKKITF